MAARTGVRALQIAALVLVLLLDVRAIRDMLRTSRVRSAEMLVSAHSIRTPVFAFDPAWSLAAGQLPPHGDGAPVVVDSYGAMLLHAVRDRRYPDTSSAFQGATQPEVRARLLASRNVVLGWRGQWQLSAADRAWFAANFRCVNPEAGELCVWERTPARSAGSIEEQTIRYGDGWYGEEGIPPETWRWMSGRLVTSLPAGPARLELTFAVPLDALERPPTISIALDGRVVDRFVGNREEVTRAYSTSARLLVITTDRTFVPGPHDTRELGLRVTRLAWRGAGASTSSSR